MFKLPKIGEKLTKEQLKLVTAIATNCRKSIIEMVKNGKYAYFVNGVKT